MKSLSRSQKNLINKAVLERVKPSTIYRFLDLDKDITNSYLLEYLRDFTYSDDESDNEDNEDIDEIPRRIYKHSPISKPVKKFQQVVEESSDEESEYYSSDEESSDEEYYSDYTSDEENSSNFNQFLGLTLVGVVGGIIYFNRTEIYRRYQEFI